MQPASDVLLHSSQEAKKGGRIENNVWQLEAAALASGIQFPSSSAIVLFDFAAAMPSVAWAWLWMVLAAQRVSATIIQLWMNFYGPARAHVEYLGNYAGAFEVQGGIRQGCPAAALSVCLAINPFLYWVSSAVSPPR
eukprot:5646829-Lingulodinium_polyedra.AAC.1